MRGFGVLLSSGRCRLPVLVVFTVVISLAHSQSTNTTGCFCLKQMLTGLQSPIHLEPTQIQAQSVYLIAQQSGQILQYDPTKTDDKLKPYIDLSALIVVSSDPGDERGLLGFALHPNFTTNGKIYLYSTRNISNLEYIAITEVTGTDLATEKYLLLVEQPGTRRNGGQLLFGMDGFLYIITGDGGPPEGTENQAQNPSNLLGKVLRIDVRQISVVDYKIQYYGIPRTNPKKDGWRPEVFGLGVRNMWRCSEDLGDPITGSGKGRIFCGELGTNIADEINILVSGANYGWNYREGLQCFNQTLCDSIAQEERLPIFTFNRSTSGIVAVVGGPVYRGSSFPALQGHYVYGDYATTSIASLQETSDGTWISSDFTACDHSVCYCHSRAVRMNFLLSIADSEEDEIFLLMTKELLSTSNKGGLYQLVPPSKTTVTCGASGFQTATTVLTFVLVLLANCIKKY